MSEPTSTNFTTLEQVLSTDLNRVGGLAGKASQDLALALLGGIDSAVAPRDVVRRGMNATSGAGLSVNIEAGEMMRFSASVVANQSQYKLGVLAALQNVVLAPADPVNPRIDRISVTDTSLFTDSSIRNVLTLPSRVVVPTLINKTKSPSVTITVTTGAAGVSPQPPATPANNVAIWDVIVPAAAVTVNDNHLMDVRVRAQPIPYTGTHIVERGMGLSIGTALTDIAVSSGRAFVRGGLLENNSNKNFAFATVQEPGAAALAADQEWHAYVVSKGSGLPIGKNMADGFIVFLSQIAPNAIGIPSSNIQYNPLQGVGGAPALSIPTQFALYIGTIHTDASGNFESGGGGLLVNRDGTGTNRTIDAVTGRFAATAGFIKRPTFSWVDISTVRVGVTQMILFGTPLVWPGGNATWATSLAADGSPSDAASTWYYVYLRFRLTNTGARGAIRTVRPIISTQAPSEFGHKPTTEAGFGGFEYLYVGSFYNNASLNIEQFTKAGNTVLFTGSKQTLYGPFVDVAISPAFTTITALAPATSKTVLIHAQFGISQSGVAGTVTARLFPTTTIANNRIEWTNQVPGTGTEVVYDLVGTPIEISTNQFRANRSAVPAGSAFGLDVWQYGYIEDIESLNL